MKKFLFGTALMVALVGCSKSNSDRMGSPASRESGTATSSTADTTSVRPRSMSPDNGNAITGPTNATESLDNPVTTTPASTNSVDLSNPQPEQPKTTPPDSTGNQSNGDLSNRPAGEPGNP